MTAKIQIKFSKAIRGEGEGESVEYDILSRRGSSEWRVVGTAEAQMAVSYDGNWCQPNQYRIGDIVADLWVEADGNDWMTFEVEVGYLPRRGHEQGLTQTATGYGGKLTTPYKAMHNGRLYRVYCMCYSNSGTNYIISKGQRLIIR